MVFGLGGEDFGFEFGERFLDQRVVLEIVFAERHGRRFFLRLLNGDGCRI